MKLAERVYGCVADKILYELFYVKSPILKVWSERHGLEVEKLIRFKVIPIATEIHYPIQESLRSKNF